MKYIDTLREGMRISEVYLCKNKQIALTKAGKEYGNLVLQDKTGTIDSKIWDLGSPGIGNFEAMDYPSWQNKQRLRWQQSRHLPGEGSWRRITGIL